MQRGGGGVYEDHPEIPVMATHVNGEKRNQGCCSRAELASKVGKATTFNALQRSMGGMMERVVKRGGEGMGESEEEGTKVVTYQKFRRRTKRRQREEEEGSVICATSPVKDDLA